MSDKPKTLQRSSNTSQNIVCIGPMVFINAIASAKYLFDRLQVFTKSTDYRHGLR